MFVIAFKLFIMLHRLNDGNSNAPQIHVVNKRQKIYDTKLLNAVETENENETEYNLLNKSNNNNKNTQ